MLRLAEGESGVAFAVGGARPEEAGTGDGGHADLPCHPFRERHVIVCGEGAEVGKEIVRPLRFGEREPRRAQWACEIIPTGAVRGGHPGVVLLGVGIADGRCLLQRCRRADGEEIMNLADRAGPFGVRDRVSQSPARDAEGLREARDGDRPLPHARKGGDRNVFAGKDDVLVRIVRDTDEVVGDAELCDLLEFRSGEDVAGRVVRRVEDDGARPWGDGGTQGVPVVSPVRGAQRHKDRGGLTEDRVRAVVLVERLEDQHFVAGIEQRQKHGGCGLGRTARHGDLTLGVDRHAVPRVILPDDGVSQGLGAPGDRVLVHIRMDGRGRGLLHGFRHREVGKPLRQVDGVVRARHPRHLANDRFGESVGPTGRRVHRHRGVSEKEGAAEP